MAISTPKLTERIYRKKDLQLEDILTLQDEHTHSVYEDLTDDIEYRRPRNRKAYPRPEDYNAENRTLLHYLR